MAGQDHFKTIQRPFYAKSNLVILIYDCSQSLEQQRNTIIQWNDEIEQQCDVLIKKVLVCNKIDLLDHENQSSMKRMTDLNPTLSESELIDYVKSCKTIQIDFHEKIVSIFLKKNNNIFVTNCIFLYFFCFFSMK